MLRGRSRCRSFAGGDSARYQNFEIFLPLFIYRAFHLRRVWVDITVCKLTTTYVRHWSQKIYIFPAVSVQHRSTCFPVILNKFTGMSWFFNRELKQPRRRQGGRRPEVTWKSVRKRDLIISSSSSRRRRQKEQFHVVVNLPAWTWRVVTPWKERIYYRLS